MDDELDLDIETEDLQECYGSLFYNFGKGYDCPETVSINGSKRC